jgi:hypothetical protein
MCLKKEGEEVKGSSIKMRLRETWAPENDLCVFGTNASGEACHHLLSFSSDGDCFFTADPWDGAIPLTPSHHPTPNLKFLQGLPKEEPVIGHSQVENLSRLQGHVDEPILEETTGGGKIRKLPF